MNEENKFHRLRELCFGATIFPEEVLNRIAKENLWNIWVPKNYGGLELSITAGLAKLKELAKIDGSLGWTVTLCSGANYFIGNLDPEAAKEIFKKPQSTVLGGSGGVFGKAEKIDDHYKISGTWRYATGASYLSHFTINAEVQENGKVRLNENNEPEIRSFVLPKKEVKIIEDWGSMGLKASATHSFEVENVMLHKRYSFIYNEFFQPQDIFKIPFSVFADLTLWVNYIGMAQHFLEEAETLKSAGAFKNLEESIAISNKKLTQYSEAIEAQIATGKPVFPGIINEIHVSASNSVKTISQKIIEAYPYLGVKASRTDQQINQVFCDYFTATQHHIFTR